MSYPGPNKTIKDKINDLIDNRMKNSPSQIGASIRTTSYIYLDDPTGTNPIGKDDGLPWLSVMAKKVSDSSNKLKHVDPGEVQNTTTNKAQIPGYKPMEYSVSIKPKTKTIPKMYPNEDGVDTPITIPPTEQDGKQNNSMTRMQLLIPTSSGHYHVKHIDVSTPYNPLHSTSQLTILPLEGYTDVSYTGFTYESYGASNMKIAPGQGTPV